MRLAILLLCPLLAGCPGSVPFIVKQPQEVNVAVRAKCIKKEEAPVAQDWPLDAVDLSDDATALPRVVNAARLEVKQRREYVKSVDKILEKCQEK